MQIDIAPIYYDDTKPEEDITDAELDQLLYETPDQTHVDYGMVMKTFKVDRSKVKKPATRWITSTFKNIGRRDHLRLCHWIKKDDTGKEFKSFASLKPLTILKYTAKEYQNLLKTPGWTKKESDHLIELCRTFGLNFHLVKDRWGKAPRTIEELKERYYCIANTLRSIRPNAEKKKTIVVYDGTFHRKRKEYLNKLYLEMNFQEVCSTVENRQSA